MVKVSLNSNQKIKSVKSKSPDGSGLFPHRNRLTLTGLSLGGFFILCILLFWCQFDCAYAEVDTTRAVIHHTASHDVSASTINEWHKERGWDGIGYHFVIRKNGTIEKGRDIRKQGAHAKGRNNWVGIVLTGYDSFDVRQSISLKELISQLKIQHIEKHHERCPGEGLNLEEILK